MEEQLVRDGRQEDGARAAVALLGEADPPESRMDGARRVLRRAAWWAGYLAGFSLVALAVLTVLVLLLGRLR